MVDLAQTTGYSRPITARANDQIVGYDELGREIRRTFNGVDYYATNIDTPPSGDAGGRGALTNLLDNIIGYDDGVETPGERLGAALNALGSGLLSDPVGMAQQAFTGAADNIGGLMAGSGTPMDAVEAAGMAMLGGMAPNVGRLADFDPTTVSMAAARDPNFWHPASRIKLQRPVSEMQFGYEAADEGFLSPERFLNIEDLEGRVLVPAFGDRTRAGGLLASIGGEDLPTPVELQGGADFMRSPGGIWASEPDAMSTKARAIDRIAQATGEEPIMAYTAMGAQAGDFSRMMSDAMMAQIRPSMENYIDPRVVRAYDARIRDTVDENWPGILSPEASGYVAGMTGSNRRLLWQEMDRTAYRDAGFPDVGATRLAITDPRLIDAQPFDTGLTMGLLNRGLDVEPTPRDVHSTYGAQIHGEYLGGLEQQLPGELVWRDFFNARREAGARPSSDQRSFMMTPSIHQRIDAQSIDEIMSYLEGLQQ